MKIILDANIVYSPSLIQSKLPTALTNFLSECSKKGHEIVITLTTKLEFDRIQKEAKEGKIQELNKAIKLIDVFRIAHEYINIDDLIIDPDLIALMEDQKVKVEFIEPTLEDYTYAHKKACLHLSPHPRESKTDEMRDLIVWSIALSIAKNNHGALLISNDNLHLNPQGDEEANRVNLFRVNNLDTALEYLEIETPNGKIVKNLIDKVWDKLVENSVPIMDKPNLRGISNVRLVEGNNGPQDIYFTMKAVGIEKKSFQADIWFQFEDDKIKNLTLDNIVYDGNRQNKVVIDLQIIVDLFTNDYEQRLNALKEIINPNL